MLTYWMKKTFAYLDRFFIPDNKLDSLSQLGLNVFRKTVFDKTNSIIVKSVFDEIDAEREGKAVDWNRIKRIMYCYRMMGLTGAVVDKEEGTGELVWQGNSNAKYYKTTFEDEFIRQTKEYYQKQSEDWLRLLSCTEYVMATLAALRKEESKVLTFLDKETRPRLMQALEAVMIEDKGRALVDKEQTGVADMFRARKADELKNLFVLLSKRPTTLHLINEKLGQYIEFRGKAIVNDRENVRDPIVFINKLLDLKREIDTMIVDSFGNYAPYVETRDKSFVSFLNESLYTPSFLAEYVDMLMRQGLKGKEATMESTIDDIFEIFRLLRQKDAFTMRHQQLYAHRLLQGTSLFQDAEDQLVSLLKIELGAQYVSKFLQMGNDIRNSLDMTNTFRKKDHNGLIKGIEINAKVLTTGLWNEQKNLRCKLPPELKECARTYGDFFRSSHIGKNISWLAAIGDCEIKTKYLPKPYTLIASIYQAAVLCLYNNQKDFYTFAQLREESGLPEEELSAQLYPLMNPKLGKLLLKENARTPKCAPDEKISINPRFVSASLKLILTPQAHHAKVPDCETLGDRKRSKTTTRRSARRGRSWQSCGARSYRRTS